MADCLTSISEAMIAIYEYRDSIPDDIINALIEEASKTINFYELAVETYFDNKIEDLGEIIDYAVENVMLNEMLENILGRVDMEPRAMILFHSILKIFRESVITLLISPRL